MTDLIVAKVGGSLFDLVDLKDRLLKWQKSVSPSRIIWLAGGGDSADVVRNWHRLHHFREVDSHWLAIRMMQVNAHFLANLLDCRVANSFDPVEISIAIDALEFCIQDEQNEQALPHTWRTTSDSIAARIAIAMNAKLTLIKSTDLPKELSWLERSQKGFVDDLFPELVELMKEPISWVNLRE